jgi:hypothetical protein
VAGHYRDFSGGEELVQPGHGEKGRGLVGGGREGGRAETEGEGSEIKDRGLAQEAKNITEDIQ